MKIVGQILNFGEGIFQQLKKRHCVIGNKFVRRRSPV